jgi:hypothetical protein
MRNLPFSRPSSTAIHGAAGAGAKRCLERPVLIDPGQVGISAFRRGKKKRKTQRERPSRGKPASMVEKVYVTYNQVNIFTRSRPHSGSMFEKLTSVSLGAQAMPVVGRTDPQRLPSQSYDCYRRRRLRAGKNTEVEFMAPSAVARGR